MKPLRNSSRITVNYSNELYLYWIPPIRNYLKHIIPLGWSDKSFWIGAHNRGENPSNYYWVNTGVRFQYSNWSPAVNHKQDQCIGLDSAADHKWRNFDCTETVNYICETSNCTE